MTLRRVFLSIFLLLLTAKAYSDSTPKIEKTEFLSSPVLFDDDSRTLTAAIIFHLSEGAHTYWINSGDTGMSPEINFDLPEGVELLEARFPVPHIFSSGSLTDYGYEEKMPVLYTFKIDEALEGPITISFDATLLVCTNMCVPAKASGRLDIDISDRDAMPDAAMLKTITEIKEQAPHPTESQSRAIVTGGGMQLQIELPEGLTQASDSFYFFPSEGGIFKNDPSQKQSMQGGTLIITLQKSPYFTEWPETLTGLLYHPSGFTLPYTNTKALEIEMEIEGE